ncbi:MAG: hypothetical protein HY560_12625 [Gemmatimonadetes bacterium]|nr:hypothetical protein [Gemmatimonadota bacterium]
MRLIEGINAIDGLYVYQPYGESNLFRYDVRDTRYNIYAVAQLLSERGWLIGQHQKPPAIHHAINPVHCQTVEPYLSDLREVTAMARERGLKGEFKKRTY